MSHRELVYRMRTCAAALVVAKASGEPWHSHDIATDAAGLLEQAASLLDEPELLGEPMALLPAQNVSATTAPPSGAVWGGVLPAADPLPCPNCGDTAHARTVRRDRGKFVLSCQVCSNQWEYSR
jgi:hypothetical protein